MHEERYDILSIALHWLIVCGVIAQATTGFLFYRLRLGAPLYDAYHFWHRSIGELVLILVGTNLVWRYFRPPVIEFRDLGWRRVVATLVQASMFALLILVPLVKIWRGAYGIGWEFFLIKISAPLPPNEFMAAILTSAHLYLAVALLVLSGIHAGAALWHELIEHDRLLRRMGI